MVGVDINPDRIERSVEIARQLGIEGYNAIVGNVESTGLDRGLADVVIAVDIAEHVQPPKNLMDECRSLLKPGGTLLITIQPYMTGTLIIQSPTY